jgi:hypothetical protein
MFARSSRIPRPEPTQDIEPGCVDLAELLSHPRRTPPPCSHQREYATDFAARKISQSTRRVSCNRRQEMDVMRMICAGPDLRMLPERLPSGLRQNVPILASPATRQELKAPSLARLSYRLLGCR